VDLIAAAYVFHLNLWLEFYFSPFYEAKIKVEASLLPTREERCPVREANIAVTHDRNPPRQVR